MPKYPAQIDNSQSLPTAIDNLTPVQGSIFNKLRDAVLAVESELGVKPSGSYTTVKSRLDTLEGIVGNLLIIELHKDLGGTLEEPLVIGLQGRPISTVPPAFGQVLAWNGIAWIPSTSSGGGGGFDPPAASSAGQTLVWDGSAYIPNFILGDDVTPPYDQTLTSAISLVEVGQQVTDPAFTATYEISPTTASITDDEFSTPTDVSSSPTSFVSPGDYTKSAYGDIVTFTLTALQGHVTKTVDYQIEWAQKVYYGLATAGQTGETFIKSLSGQPITNTKNISFAINAGTGQKIYYACRSIYGDMVFTIHDIEGGFTKTQSGVNITNDFGFTEEYDLYESDYASLGALNIFVGDGDDFFQSGGGPIGPIGPTGPAGDSVIIFDGGNSIENIRSDRIAAQSPIDDNFVGQNNFSSAEDIDDGNTPTYIVNSGTSGNFSAILSGNFNEVRSGYSTITGGLGNRILTAITEPTFSFIGGGKDNTINEDAGSASNIIVGGTNNTIQSGAYHTCILGGIDNIGGGSQSVILGGSEHTINSNTSLSSIVGGFSHAIGISADYCVIIGGSVGEIEGGDYSAILAGDQNTITNGNNSAIISGYSNNIIGSLSYSTIVSGGENIIDSSNYSSILGGYSHQIIGNSYNSIIGGQEGSIENAAQSVIIGGFNNQINNQVNSIILGGFGNTIDANHSVIIGGFTNTILGDASAIIGDSNIVGDFSSNSLVVGSYAQSIRFGQIVHSSVGAKFGSGVGLSQFSIYSVANQSVDDTVIQLTDAFSSELYLENGKSYSIKATCIANRVDSSNRFTSVDYILAHQDAGIAIIDDITSIYTADDGVPWTITYTVNGVDDILSANFAGAVSHTVNVMVTYEISEVSQ